MDAFVGVKVGFTLEGFITVETLERFLPVVPRQVVLKDIFPVELFTTYWTAEERFGSLMAIF